MRSFLSDFQVVNPASLQEALEVLASEENVMPLAGATDIMVYLEAGVLKPCTLLNLHAIPEFHREIKIDKGLELSPLTSYQEVRMNPKIKEFYPMMAAASKEVGVLAIQSRGTWAGNIVNASPAADGVPALMLYDAEVELSSVRGKRSVALCDFYKGYKQMERKPDELISAIFLPEAPKGRKEYYRKVGARKLQAITKVLLTASLKMNEEQKIEDIRLILGSVAPFTLRARNTEKVLLGAEISKEKIEEALEVLQSEINPIDDIRSDRTYRRKVAGNLLREFLKS